MHSDGDRFGPAIRTEPPETLDRAPRRLYLHGVTQGVTSCKIAQTPRKRDRENGRNTGSGTSVFVVQTVAVRSLRSCEQSRNSRQATKAQKRVPDAGDYELASGHKPLAAEQEHGWPGMLRRAEEGAVWLVGFT